MRNETTVDEEVKMAFKQNEEKIHGFRGLKISGTIPEQILRTFFSSCKTEAKRAIQANPLAIKNLLNTIEFFVAKELPIALSLTFALFMRANNRLKFSESDNVPHLGWIDFLKRLKYMAAKVKIVYPPGLKIFLFEEASLFHPVIKRTPSDVAEFKKIVDLMITGLDLNEELVVIPISEMGFPSFYEWKDCAKSIEIEDPVIFAMIMSLPMDDYTILEEISGLLYMKRDRDYSEIKSKMEHLWEDARIRASYIRDVMNRRKSIDLWGNAIASNLGIKSCLYIDAAVTMKAGRIVPDLGVVLPNHGIAVKNGGESIINTPEHRITDAHPIYCNNKIFYYQKD